MKQPSFPSLDKNVLTAASSALAGMRLSAQPVVCLAFYAVSVIVYLYSAITALVIDALTSVIFVFLVS
jgi:hypothetical protein